MFQQRWFEDKVEKHVNGEIVKRLNISGFIVGGEIKRVITDKGLIKSGMYRASIVHEVHADRLAVRIGSPLTNPPYPLFLEVGTSKGIPAHAPMRTGLSNSASRLKAVWR